MLFISRSIAESSSLRICSSFEVVRSIPFSDSIANAISDVYGHVTLRCTFFLWWVKEQRLYTSRSTAESSSSFEVVRREVWGLVVEKLGVSALTWASEEICWLHCRLSFLAPFLSNLSRLRSVNIILHYHTVPDFLRDPEFFAIFPSAALSLVSLALRYSL